MMILFRGIALAKKVSSINHATNKAMATMTRHVHSEKVKRQWSISISLERKTILDVDQRLKTQV